MLNITNYQINKKYSAVSPHIGQNGQYQTVEQKIHAGEGGERGTPLPCWWECNFVQESKEVP